MWCRGSGELDFTLVYRNSGEWTLRSWMEEVCVCTDFCTFSCSPKQFLVGKISVPSAAIQKQ